MRDRLSRCNFFILFIIFLVFAAGVQAETQNKDEADGDALADLSLNAFKLRGIGPALTSGRISDFAVNPHNRFEYYVATSSGGVWKTTNGGNTFKPIFDRQGSYSIGCITMDPNNPHVIWVGTGENNNQRSVSYGDGVYKSEDGGQTWDHMGLKESEHVGMIVVDPRDSDVVYVAAYGPLWSAGGDRGLYKSADRGKTWKPVLTVSEHTGVSEVHLDPRDPDVVYAVAHQRRRRVWTLIDGGPESGLYKSRDGGAAWDKINRGLPSGHLGRIGLDISPVNPDILYAIVEAQGDKGGFYRSINRGASWERRSGYTSRGNYYQEIFCDPVDVERVYSMDTYLQVTDDGGKSFRSLGERYKHVDNHAMWIDPEHPDYYLVGCDGGIYESFDRGQTWRYMPNLPVTQFYKVSLDQAEPFYNVFGGTQDNYSLAGPSRTASAQGIANEDWFVTQGGDGFETQVDPENPNIIYAQSQYGGLVRYDKQSGQRMGIKPSPREGEAAYRWNWDAPLLISPHSHKRLYFAANKLFRSNDYGNSWEVISGDLTRQIDRNKLEVMGRIWPMDAVAKNASTSEYGTIVALDESPLKEGLLYVGTDDGLIQVSEDGGENWRKISSFPGIPERTYVDAVLASRHDENVVFAAFNNHKSGDFTPYIMKSANRGRSWTSIASNLPERGSVYSLAQDHVDKDILFAGTEFGLFVTLDGGQSWKALQSGLPTIAVRDLAIQKREDDLALATFGRGFYILDDYSPLRNLDKTAGQKEAHIFPVKDALMYIERSRIGDTGRRSHGFQGETFFTAPNPPLGATFTYYVKETITTLEEERRKKEKELFKKGKPVYYPAYEELKAEEEEEEPFLEFIIMDQNDNPVRKLRASAKAGVHRITWDLRLPDRTFTRSRNQGAIRSAPSRILAAPGMYKVVLSRSVDGEKTRLTEPVSFNAVTLGNVTLPAEDREALAAFQKKVSRLSSAVNAASQTMQDLYSKVTHYRIALKTIPEDAPNLKEKIDQLESSLDSIRIQLYGDPLKRRLDQPSKPGLSRRINSIIYQQWRSTSAPTETQKRDYRITAEDFEPVQKSIRNLAEQEAAQIETRLKEMGAPYTPDQLPDWKK